MPTANNLDFKLEKQTSVLDAENNTVECFFDISGSGLQLANQYIAFGDGLFANKNERIVVNDLSNVTISLKAGQNHFLKLVQKYNSSTYYSPLAVYAMAQPSIGTFHNVFPLDKAFRVDICYNQLDLDQFASDVARLINNYSNLLDMEAIIYIKAKQFLLDKYGEDIAKQLRKVLTDRHGIDFMEDDPSLDAPLAVGASGEGGGGGGGGF